MPDPPSRRALLLAAVGGAAGLAVAGPVSATDPAPVDGLYHLLRAQRGTFRLACSYTLIDGMQGWDQPDPLSLVTCPRCVRKL